MIYKLHSGHKNMFSIKEKFKCWRAHVGFFGKTQVFFGKKYLAIKLFCIE